MKYVQSVSVGEHRDRAGIECGTRVLGAMCRGSVQCGEQVAGSSVLGAQCHSGDAQIRWHWRVGEHRTEPGRQRGQSQTRRGPGPQGTGHHRSPPVGSVG